MDKQKIITMIPRLGGLLAITIAFISKNILFAAVSAVACYALSSAIEAVLCKRMLGRVSSTVSIFKMLKRMDLKAKFINLSIVFLPVIILVLSCIFIAWAL